jgi:cytochrome P450
MTVNAMQQQDWDPRSEAVQRDQRAAYDEMRERCPVAYSDFLGWSLFRHEDILRVLNDPATFSNAVSRHLSVPDGMDPPEHTAFRRMIMPYFEPERVAAFEPQCREIAATLVQALQARDEVEFIDNFANGFAIRSQCASLGWPLDLCEPLRLWTAKNRQATFAEDRAAMAEIAREFEGYVQELLKIRRVAGDQASDDITSSLLRQRVQGRPLRDEEIVSVLRNWTVGEIGTISAALGILAHHLSEHPDLQQQLRTQPSLLPAAIEEILRIHGPLVANRRITTRAVEIGGRKIAAGERISLIWISANRDGRVFEDPATCRLDRDQTANLLYGAGIHVCPGAPLARMEMRVAVEELLAHTACMEPVPERPPTTAVYPGSGFAALPLRIR